MVLRGHFQTAGSSHFRLTSLRHDFRKHTRHPQNANLQMDMRLFPVAERLRTRCPLVWKNDSVTP